MESTLSATTMLLTMSKTLNPSSNPFICRLHGHFSATRRSQCLRSQFVSLQLKRLYSEFQRSKPLNSTSYSSNSLRSLYALAVPPVGSRLECVASSAASFGSTAGGNGGGIGWNGGGGGGGDGESGGGEANSNSVVGGSEEVSALSPDVIILDVGGMTCGGCAASVKRILESQPQVSSASVNLATETAIVWPASEAKVIPNWKKHLGETLAKHLTSCGFNSNLRGEEGAIEGDIPS